MAYIAPGVEQVNAQSIDSPSSPSEAAGTPLVWSEYSMRIEITDVGSVFLEYDPSTLVKTTTSQSFTRPGVNTLISYVGSPEQSYSEISLTTFFSAFAPSEVALDLISAQNGLIGALTLFASTSEELTSTLSLAKGVFDRATGFVHKSPVAQIGGNLKNTMLKVKLLEDAIKKGSPCRIKWDIEEETSNLHYLIQSMNLSVENFASGNKSIKQGISTLLFKIDLKFIQHGTFALKVRAGNNV
jgi:hypothetical protein